MSRLIAASRVGILLASLFIAYYVGDGFIRVLWVIGLSGIAYAIDTISQRLAAQLHQAQLKLERQEEHDRVLIDLETRLASAEQSPMLTGAARAIGEL